jgi:TnpA family transposase
MAAASGISCSQLARVYDWYVREETLRRAIRLLVRYQQSLPLAAAFGSETASLASTLHFDLATAGAHALRSPPLDLRRGVQLPTRLSDQGVPFWLTVASPLVQETCYALEGLVSKPLLPIGEQSMDATGAVVDVLFGLFEVLGYRFTPYLRDLPDQLLARVGDDPAYGALGAVLRHPVRESLILSQWDEMNRLAVSLRDQLLLPSLVIARLQEMRRPCPLQQALQEVGYLAKTRYILNYVDDAALRRRVLVRLSRGERLQAMARALFFGQQGRFNQYDHEAQLTQALALNLVIAAIIVWNTHYLEVAANALACRGQPVPEEMWADFSPILWEHLSLIGKFPFDGPLIGAERGMRQKR